MTDLGMLSTTNGAALQPAFASGSAWSRVRRELVYFSFTVQEASLLTPFVLVVMSWSRFWPPALVFLWLLLLILVPFNLLRLMSLLQWERTRQRRVMAVAMVVTVILSWRMLLYEASSPFDLTWLRQFATNMAEAGNLVWTRDLSIFVFTIFGWWRGMRLASKTLSIGNAGLRLRVGGLIIMPLVAWLATSFLEFSVVPFILLFFLSSLAAVALVRAEHIEADRTGHAATLSAGWFLTVLAAALGVVLLGGALAAFISGESLFQVLGVFSPLWRSLQFGGTVSGLTMFELLQPLLDVFAAAVQFLATILASILGRVSEGVRFLSGTIPEQPPLPTLEVTPEVVTAPPAMGKIVAAGLMLGLILLIAWGLSKLYQQATFAARESRRSGPLQDSVANDSALDRLLQRFGVFQQWRAAASIRRIYENMCHAAAAAGYPRLEAETPYEYLATLAKTWPAFQSDSRLITEAFVRIRYGELPETPEEFAEIQEAWRRLESAEVDPLDQPKEALPTLEKRQ